MARYEKTIAGNDFVFDITISSTYETVYNLLTQGQKTLFFHILQIKTLLMGMLCHIKIHGWRHEDILKPGQKLY